MSGINRTYKYWELYFDEDDNCQCIATHWSDEWNRASEVVKYDEDELLGLIRDSMEFAKIYRDERVTSRSINPAIKEFKKIVAKYDLK